MILFRDDYKYRARPITPGLQRDFRNGRLQVVGLPVYNPSLHILSAFDNAARAKAPLTAELVEANIDKARVKEMNNRTIALKKALDQQSQQTRISNSISFFVLEEEVYVAGGTDPYVTIPFVPVEVKFDPSTGVHPLNVLGRNTQPYHYGGSEDTVTFEIDWYGYPSDKDQILMKCRKLEALSRGNGWNGTLPLVHISWGAKDQMFKDHIFIVAKAPYTVSHFTHQRMFGKRKYHNALLPVQAKQKITLKRVSPVSLTTADIIGDQMLHKSNAPIL